MSNTFHRYAIFFSPRPDEPLAEFGRRWFGLDTETRQPVEDAWPIPTGLLRTPRRYGFHATLKAPFRLRKGRAEEGLLQAVEALAGELAPRELGLLVPKELGSFITLQQSLPNPAVDELAFTCVRDLDLFRQPLTEEEQDAIFGKGISRKQKGNVYAWGYPYVGSEYIFHMTLTSILAPHEIPEWKQKVLEWGMEYLAEPVTLRDLCVFAQPSAEEPFRPIARFPLTGSGTGSGSGAR